MSADSATMPADSALMSPDACTMPTTDTQAQDQTSVPEMTGGGYPGMSSTPSLFGDMMPASTTEAQTPTPVHSDMEGMEAAGEDTSTTATSRKNRKHKKESKSRKERKSRRERKSRKEHKSRRERKSRKERRGRKH